MSKTETEREILLTAQRNPDASHKEIGRIVGCSASYVSQTLRKYSNYSGIDAAIDQTQKDLDNIGNGFF